MLIKFVSVGSEVIHAANAWSRAANVSGLSASLGENPSTNFKAFQAGFLSKQFRSRVVGQSSASSNVSLAPSAGYHSTTLPHFNNTRARQHHKHTWSAIRK